MAAKKPKMTLKKFEKSSVDKAMDKKSKLKEGSKKEIASDKKAMKKFKGK